MNCLIFSCHFYFQVCVSFQTTDIAVCGISFHTLTSIWFLNFSVILDHQLFTFFFKKKVIIKAPSEVVKFLTFICRSLINWKSTLCTEQRATFKMVLKTNSPSTILDYVDSVICSTPFIKHRISTHCWGHF